MASDPRVHTLRLREFGVPKRLLRSRLDETASPKALQFVESLPDRYVTNSRPADNYPDDPSNIGKGLLWVGTPGTGKTTEAAKTLLECYWRWNVRVRFLAFADLIGMRTEQFRLEGKPEAEDRWWAIEQVIESARTVGVLLLDDVGKEHRTKTGFAENELNTLVRQRHRDGLPTLVTTNVRLPEWGTVYNESMGSFIHEAFEHIALIGKDHRRV